MADGVVFYDGLHGSRGSLWNIITHHSRVRLLEVIKLATWKPTKYNIVLDSIKKLVRPQASRLMIRGIDQLLMIYICVSSGT